MLQAEPAGISACNAKSLPPNKLVLSGSELCKQFATWDVLCHLCKQALHVIVQRCKACRVWSATCSCIATAWHTGLQQSKCCSSASEKSICNSCAEECEDVVRGSYLSSPSPSVVQNRACGCWCVLAKHASRTLSESDRATTCSIVVLTTLLFWPQTSNHKHAMHRTCYHASWVSTPSSCARLSMFCIAAYTVSSLWMRNPICFRQHLSVLITAMT